jgi:hypothetical protein
MLQAVPPPPRPAGRVTSYHNLPQTTSTPVRFSGPIEVYSALNLNSQQDPQSPTTEEEESMSPSDSNDEEFDIQQKDLQLPPELLLQQAFTGHSAVVNIDQINAEAARQKGASLRMLDHSDWKKIAEVDFPDLPLWFDNQVCTFFGVALNKMCS